MCILVSVVGLEIGWDDGYIVFKLWTRKFGFRRSEGGGCHMIYMYGKGLSCKCTA